MKILSVLAVGLLAFVASAQESFINLTPAPKSMTVAEGELVLPRGFKVSAIGHEAEVAKFVDAVNAATGLESTAGSDGLITVVDLDGSSPAHYDLTVSEEGVTIRCGSDEGLYYAFQTLKKLLPANVMAGVREEKVYSLPCLTISDEPRFEYRGFMLDVSRHFFPVEDVKRMLDVMSYYKMNYFHWHLADDQGWRIEMPDYPRLMTVGATAENSEIVDMYTKTDYWLNKTYGPYYYTQQELRDIVSYAAERHITVVPEVEFPGHFKAILAAYPEFSLNPEGGHSVAVTGGVYGDVMNLANPAAIKFAEDVIDTLCDIFPSKLIHLGGDECPDSGWVTINDKGSITGGNEECKAMYRREGCTHPRQLQSILTKHLADYAASKGRTIGVWNESISAAGTDEKLMRQTGATVWCWTGADAAVNKAVSLGLHAIYTPISQSSATKGSFYINRSQHPDDPPANGYKCDDVKSVYNTIPFTTQALKNNPELCFGVQGTFWSERVAYREYLEYLALPRLLAIAEIGWTPQEGKNWESFQKRMSADRELLDYNDYKYSPYHMLGMETPSTPEPCEPSDFEVGAKYYFENTSATFKGHHLYSGIDKLFHTDNPFSASTLWEVAEADNARHTVKLKSMVFTNKYIAAAGASAGREAKPVIMGDEAAEIVLEGTSDGYFTMKIGGDVIWLSPNGTVRAGETKTDGGVSPLQGSTWRAVKGEKREFIVYLNGEQRLPISRAVPTGTTDFTDYAPDYPGFKLDRFELGSSGTVNLYYISTAEYTRYFGFLENGVQIYKVEELRPLGSTEFNIPEIDGYTLVSTSAPTNSDSRGLWWTVRSIYTTDSYTGVKQAGMKVTGITPGEAYLIRDAHSDRNAYRCATTSGTVNGAKVASNLSPMFTWTFEGENGVYKVKNLATATYVGQLARSQTAKLSASGSDFTWTYDTDHWTAKGTNGMYWDGLDNLDLVGWDGGTGHPLEIYEFIGAPFHKVTIKSVDNHGRELANEYKYAPRGETFVVGLPYRRNYTITDVQGREALKNITADAEVTIVYTKDTELGIEEVSAADSSSVPVYDLQGRRVITPGRGIYIIDGRKQLCR